MIEKRSNVRPAASAPRRPAPAPADRRAPPPERRGRDARVKVGSTAIGVLTFLAILPAGALIKLGGLIDWRVVAGCVVLISLCTWLIYRWDKQRAGRDGWRTPESTLHALEFFGGWPAAFLAQRWFRHKIAKRIYQVNFWAIVALHQFVAFDYLLDWRYSQAALVRLNPAEWLGRILPPEDQNR